MLLEVKFSIYLNRRVFVMYANDILQHDYILSRANIFTAVNHKLLCVGYKKLQQNLLSRVDTSLLQARRCFVLILSRSKVIFYRALVFPSYMPHADANLPTTSRTVLCIHKRITSAV